MDGSGRVVVPKELRQLLGMDDGGSFDISLYGSGLHLEPEGPRARLERRDGHLVLVSERVVTDEDVRALIDDIRR